MNNSDRSRAAEAVVKVGDGRGFVMETADQDRIVVTAAHCLPHLPPAIAAAYLAEGTYPNFLGPLDARGCTVWAECLFVDPIADIAVLGAPDDQSLFVEFEVYCEFVKSSKTLAMADFENKASAWLLSLDGEWIPCVAIEFGRLRALWISEATQGIESGMSGSPIVNDEGKAIGVLGTAGGTPDEPKTASGPQARLLHNLPGWLLRELQAA